MTPGSNADAMIRASGLYKTYSQGEDRVRALRDVSLEVAAGEFVAIAGPSGSGKSTLMHILGGLDRPDQGEVVLDGRDLASMRDEELALLRRRRIGFVLQFFNLMPTLTARENVAFPLLLDGSRDALRRADERLAAVGLTERAAHRPSQLSGGEQQRVALARALVTAPAVVFADEPTGNLDSHTGREILGLLRAAADDGQTIVMVTHDEGASAFADRAVHLADGAVVSDARKLAAEAGR